MRSLFSVFLVIGLLALFVACDSDVETAALYDTSDAAALDSEFILDHDNEPNVLEDARMEWKRFKFHRRQRKGKVAPKKAHSPMASLTDGGHHGLTAEDLGADTEWKLFKLFGNQKKTKKAGQKKGKPSSKKIASLTSTGGHYSLDADSEWWFSRKPKKIASLTSTGGHYALGADSEWWFSRPKKPTKKIASLTSTGGHYSLTADGLLRRHRQYKLKRRIRKSHKKSKKANQPKKLASLTRDGGHQALDTKTNMIELNGIELNKIELNDIPKIITNLVTNVGNEAAKTSKQLISQFTYEGHALDAEPEANLKELAALLRTFKL